jgi:ATP-dependent exoDNAse (exonuclease V) beta subunit
VTPLWYGCGTTGASRSDQHRKRDEVEEDNLYYVAVTRAKYELILVDGLGREREEE